MRGTLRGEQYTQVDNHDPFAAPVWRSPVHRSPEPVIWLVQAVRLVFRLAWFLIRHPLPGLACAVVAVTWAKAGWPGPAALALAAIAALAGLRAWQPDRFTRWVTVPARSRWRWWCYRRHWHPVMTIAGLAAAYRGKVMLPELGKVKNATNEKAKRLLGWTPRSSEEALVATAESLMRLGLLKDSVPKAA